MVKVSFEANQDPDSFPVDIAFNTHENEQMLPKPKSSILTLFAALAAAMRQVTRHTWGSKIEFKRARPNKFHFWSLEVFIWTK